MAQFPVIEVSDLVKVYGGETRAVDGISFEIAPGELFGFLGPDGAGRTTTIRSLSTLLRATGGRARVAGFDVSQPDDVSRRLGLAMHRRRGRARRPEAQRRLRLKRNRQTLLSLGVDGAVMQTATLWAFARLAR